MARGVQRVGVQEGVALAVGQFDEAIALVGLEPFDDGVDRRPRRRRRAKPNRRSIGGPPKPASGPPPKARAPRGLGS